MVGLSISLNGGWPSPQLYLSPRSLSTGSAPSERSPAGGRLETMESNSLLPVPGEGIGRGAKEAESPIISTFRIWPRSSKAFSSLYRSLLSSWQLALWQALDGLWAVNVFFILSGYWINHISLSLSLVPVVLLPFLPRPSWGHRELVSPLLCTCCSGDWAGASLVERDVPRACLVRSPVWWVQSMLLIYTGQAYLLPQVSVVSQGNGVLHSCTFVCWHRLGSPLCWRKEDVPGSGSDDTGVAVVVAYSGD